MSDKLMEDIEPVAYEYTIRKNGVRVMFAATGYEVQEGETLLNIEPLFYASPVQPAAVLEPVPDLSSVEGDKLPSIGSEVFIHMARSDTWQPHTVVGYYAWSDLNGNEFLHRVFVRVRDTSGNLNARLLKDVLSAAPKLQGEDQ